MAKYYSQIIWGFVLVYININLGVFDIFPNFIGYILIAYGLDGLSESNELYKKGIIPAVTLVIASLLSIFYPVTVNTQSLSPSTLWQLGIPAFYLILNLPLNYAICAGIYHDAEIKEDSDLMSRAKTRWNLLLYCTLLKLLLTPFILTIGDYFMILNIVVSIILLIVAISIIGLLRSGREHHSTNEVGL